MHARTTGALSADLTVVFSGQDIQSRVCPAEYLAVPHRLWHLTSSALPELSYTHFLSDSILPQDPHTFIPSPISGVDPADKSAYAVYTSAKAVAKAVGPNIPQVAAKPPSSLPRCALA
jgi:hypothetical protein